MGQPWLRHFRCHFYARTLSETSAPHIPFDHKICFRFWTHPVVSHCLFFFRLLSFTVSPASRTNKVMSSESLSLQHNFLGGGCMLGMSHLQLQQGAFLEDAVMVNHNWKKTVIISLNRTNVDLQCMRPHTSSKSCTHWHHRTGVDAVELIPSYPPHNISVYTQVNESLMDAVSCFR